MKMIDVSNVLSPNNKYTKTFYTDYSLMSSLSLFIKNIPYINGRLI